MPSFSKYLWFQCQAFPRNVLAVLCDFKRLQDSKSKMMFLQTFAVSQRRDAAGGRSDVVRFC
jgi:hypothetical protein